MIRAIPTFRRSVSANRFLVALLPGLILLASAPCLQAQAVQDFPEIQMNESMEGTLSEDAPTSIIQGPFRVYRFEGQAGMRYVVDARSEDFDAYLVLAHPVGGITEVLQEDDDGGDGSDARLIFAPEHSGTYLLIVRGWRSSSSGVFTLSLGEAGPEAEAEAWLESDTPASPGVGPEDLVVIAPGQTVEGEIIGQEYNHLLTMEVEGDEVLQIGLESDDFDAFLEVGMLFEQGDTANLLDVLWSDDDGGDGTNSLLWFRVPERGRLAIRVGPWGSIDRGSGRYTLRVESFEPRSVDRRPLEIGSLVNAEIRPGDVSASTEAERFVQEWTVEGRAGDRLSIRMRSPDFDTYLSFGRTDASGAFEELATNDDAPDDGFNSHILITLPADGTYLVLASPLSPSSVGHYTLEVTVHDE